MRVSNHGKLNAQADAVLLIRELNQIPAKIESTYTDWLKPLNITSIGLAYNKEGKCPVSVMKPCCEQVLKTVVFMKVKTLLVADASYFKYLTKVRKVDPHHGYICACKIKGYEHINVILSVTYTALFYDPGLQTRIDLSLHTLVNFIKGTHVNIGTNIIHSAHYPTVAPTIKTALAQLHHHPALTCDIETYGLALNKAGLGSISFAWDEHNGIAFPVDLQKGNSRQTRLDLRDFFIKYEGTLIFHGGNFDIKIIVHELFMKTNMDYVNMLLALHTMFKKVEDTKLIAYLATNTTAGNKLGLKHLAHEFAGNWAKDDIDDITKIPVHALLEYNLVDCLSTWFVYKKFKPMMIKDQQESIYTDVFLPALKVITQMELVGMPMSHTRIYDLQSKLKISSIKMSMAIKNNPIIESFNKVLRFESMVLANRKLKTKVKALTEFDDIQFNPNSNKQLATLFFQHLNYTVIDTTDTGQPSTGAGTLKKLLRVSKDNDTTKLLNDLISLSEISIILGTFIKAFVNKTIRKTNFEYSLHGNFNLGGTVSGRLSSNGPNLTNLPSTGTIYAKPIKECFRAPKGWLMVGADFDSLEDKVSALTTKDKNKLKVYLEGYDGHSLRAFSYFGSEMPDINPDLESINSIGDKYPHLRQKSKGPTFLLTYGGTFHGLMNTIGLDKDESIRIETNYHDLYQEADQWVYKQLQQAGKDGYVTGAFGLRLRTPILKQTMLGKKSTPYEAAKEGRTAGNMLGQSYGLLNTRAANEFMSRVWSSKYRLDILPICQIHDSIYLIIRDTLGCIQWVNNNLIECMEWQELDELKHDVVKLSAKMEIYYPNWSKGYTIPNKATFKQIKEICYEK